MVKTRFECLCEAIEEIDNDNESFKFIKALGIDDDKRVNITKELWEENEPLVREALNTKFIQGIKKGDLHPMFYARYMLQDTAYCGNCVVNLFKVAKQYGNLETDKEATKHWTEEEKRSILSLANFIYSKSVSYNSAFESLKKEFSIKGIDSLELGQATTDYIELGKSITDLVVENKGIVNPAYIVVSILPCVNLGPWLAREIENEGGDKLYKDGINSNKSVPEKVVLGNNFVNNFYNGYLQGWNKDEGEKGKIRRAFISSIYEKAMLCEVNFFRGACNEPLFTSKDVQKIKEENSKKNYDQLIEDLEVGGFVQEDKNIYRITNRKIPVDLQEFEAWVEAPAKDLN